MYGYLCLSGAHCGGVAWFPWVALDGYPILKRKVRAQKLVQFRRRTPAGITSPCGRRKLWSTCLATLVVVAPYSDGDENRCEITVDQATSTKLHAPPHCVKEKCVPRSLDRYGEDCPTLEGPGGLAFICWCFRLSGYLPFLSLVSDGHSSQEFGHLVVGVGLVAPSPLC